MISATTLLGTLRTFSLYLMLLPDLGFYLLAFGFFRVSGGWLVGMEDFGDICECLLDVGIQFGTDLLKWFRTS